MTSASLTFARQQSMVGDVVDGLRHVHEHGLCHRDLHPGNVMRRRDGKWVLIDFGLMAVSGTAESCGTLWFKSVSCMAGLPCRPHDDLEGLAYIMWDLELAAGLPWRRGPQSHSAVRRKKLNTLPPAGLGPFLERCRAGDGLDYGLAIDAAAALWPEDAFSEESRATFSSASEVAPNEAATGNLADAGNGLWSWLSQDLMLGLAVGMGAAVALGSCGLATVAAMPLVVKVGGAASFKASCAGFGPSLWLAGASLKQEELPASSA